MDARRVRAGWTPAARACPPTFFVRQANKASRSCSKNGCSSCFSSICVSLFFYFLERCRFSSRGSERVDGEPRSGWVRRSDASAVVRGVPSLQSNRALSFSRFGCSGMSCRKPLLKTQVRVSIIALGMLNTGTCIVSTFGLCQCSAVQAHPRSGLGLTWEDLSTKRRPFSQGRMHTEFVSTAALFRT